MRFSSLPAILKINSVKSKLLLKINAFDHLSDTLIKRELKSNCRTYELHNYIMINIVFYEIFGNQSKNENKIFFKQNVFFLFLRLRKSF